jgi:hypothetical protein
VRFAKESSRACTVEVDLEKYKSDDSQSARTNDSESV